MTFLIIAILCWAASVYFIWCWVKAGADEDARREELRKHLERI